VGTTYLQDVGAPLPVVLAEMTAGQATQYTYGGDLVMSADPSGTVAYYHADGLGSTRALSGSTGARTDAYSYDAFGAVRSHTGSATQPFGFAGEQADEELDLVFLRARYYDPETGVFVSRDRLGGTDALSQSRNRHVYAANNPIMMVDLSGNAWYEPPIVEKFRDMSSGGEQYGTKRSEYWDKVSSLAYDDSVTIEELDQIEREAMEGLKQALTNEADIIMTAPCTSLNPSCGISSFLPSPLKWLSGAKDLLTSPLKWIGSQIGSYLTKPIQSVPSLYIEHQFNTIQGGPSILGSHSIGPWTEIWATIVAGRVDHAQDWGAPPSGSK
jgi:RHS repeat-associated protein